MQFPNRRPSKIYIPQSFLYLQNHEGEISGESRMVARLRVLLTYHEKYSERFAALLLAFTFYICYTCV